MKRSVIILIIAATAFISSCKMESQYPTTDYAIYMAGTYQGHTPYFVMGDSTLTFTSNGFETEELKDKSLIILKWNCYSVDEGQGYKTVETMGYQLLNQSAAFNTSKPDTLGNDPADIAFSSEDSPILWKMGGVHDAPLFLNLYFNYAAASSSSGKHYAFLTYDKDKPISDGYFNFKFSHRAGDDTTGTQQVFRAFSLPSEAGADTVKGITIKFDGMGTNREAKYYRYTYATGKTERYSPHATEDALPALSNR